MRARAVPAESNVADLSGSRSFGVGSATGPSQEKSGGAPIPLGLKIGKRGRNAHTIDGMPMPTMRVTLPQAENLGHRVVDPMESTWHVFGALFLESSTWSDFASEFGFGRAYRNRVSNTAWNRCANPRQNSRCFSSEPNSTSALTAIPPHERVNEFPADFPDLPSSVARARSRDRVRPSHGAIGRGFVLFVLRRLHGGKSAAPPRRN